MSSNPFLAFTAVLEALTGLALILSPATVVRLLLGATLEEPAAAVVARLTGFALLALALICWTVRNDVGGAARGVVAGMLVYNAGAVLLLTYARMGLGMAAVGLIVAVLAHAALAVWCVVCLASRQA